MPGGKESEGTWGKFGEGGGNPSEEGLPSPFPKPHPPPSQDFRLYRIPVGRLSPDAEGAAGWRVMGAAEEGAAGLRGGEGTSGRRRRAAFARFSQAGREDSRGWREKEADDGRGIQRRFPSFPRKTGGRTPPKRPRAPPRPTLTLIKVFEREEEGVWGRGRGNLLQQVSPSPPPIFSPPAHSPLNKYFPTAKNAVQPRMISKG